MPTRPKTNKGKKSTERQVDANGLKNIILTLHLRSYSSRLMITSKAQMLQVMKNCDGADTLTRTEKFEVFVRVCDNMLKEGRLSKVNHRRWTNICEGYFSEK